MGWQWHQLDRMQTICSSLQCLNTQFFMDQILFLTPNQQCQNTEGNFINCVNMKTIDNVVRWRACTVICKRSSGTRLDWITRQPRTATSWPPESCSDVPATASVYRRAVRGRRRYHSRYWHCMRVGHLLCTVAPVQAPRP